MYRCLFAPMANFCDMYSLCVRWFGCIILFYSRYGRNSSYSPIHQDLGIIRKTLQLTNQGRKIKTI